MKSTHLFVFAMIGLLNYSCSKLDLPPTFSVVNEPDELVVTIANMDAYNGTENYTYTCTSDTSEITFSGALQSGLMKLKVTDPNNQEVFNKTLTSISGNVYLVNAPAGDWNVLVQGVNANGTWTTTINRQD